MPIYSQRNSINFKLKLLHFLDLAILKNQNNDNLTDLNLKDFLMIYKANLINYLRKVN